MNDIPWNFVAVAGGAAVLWIFVMARGVMSKKAITSALALGATVVDVRSKEEFNSGHYRNAIHIPHDRISAKAASLGAKDAPIVLYCASGARAGMAARSLKAAGFTKVINAGGYASMPS